MLFFPIEMLYNVTANYFFSGVQLIYTLKNKLNNQKTRKQYLLLLDMLKDFSSNFLKI